MNGSLYKNILWAVMIMMAISIVFSYLGAPAKEEKTIGLGELAAQINDNKVSEIQVRGNELAIIYTDETIARSEKENEAGLTESLKNLGVTAEALRSVKIGVVREGGLSFWAGILIPTLLPLILVGFIFWIMFRQARTGANQAFSFGRSNIRLSTGKDRTMFKDVAGLNEAKEELMEVVDFLKNPKKFTDLGAKIPRGVLLMGQPGTGKTMLAKATAGESNVPFFHVSASEFVEMFVGVGASVSGDTPVLIRTSTGTRLMPIKQFADQYYSDGTEGYRPLSGVATLGFKPRDSKFWGSRSAEKKFFGGSRWSPVGGVYRHKVKTIFKIRYRGGSIKTTGDHSIFVRSGNMVAAKRAAELVPGDVLVNLPFKVRGAFIPGLGTTHYVRAHEFPEGAPEVMLNVYGEERDAAMFQYRYALENRTVLTQAAIGRKIGMSQSGVKDWQIGNRAPRIFSSNLALAGAPGWIRVTEELTRLLGYYTAEGSVTRYATTFTFGLHEKDLHQDCANLIERIFHLQPRLLPIPQTNSLRVIVSSPFVARFFERQCGNGSHNKHLPETLWDLPAPLFLSYLEGYSRGDGYTTREGKLSVTSVSQQLIRELAWLCAMHGIQAGVRIQQLPAGRVIRENGKPLPATTSWNLIIGKTAHPFKENEDSPSQFKKPIVEKIEAIPYHGYVYDLCGCEHEAFFGGEKPLLLHNSRIRDAFTTAKKAAPSILFIDEIDAIGRQRGAGLGGGNDEREQTLNQILVELDGFEKETRLIVLAATNRPDVLDPALLRPGRFDRRVVLDLPDLRDREAILKIHAAGKALEPAADLKRVAMRTAGFSGADLANLMNEGAILAARESKKTISQQHLYDAVEKVILGPERRTRVISDREKEITAYHEGGHALVAASLKDSDKVHKVSIISRGFAGGYTMKLPEEDQRLRTRTQFLTDIAVMMGGYTSEKLTFNDISTGASNDLKNASELARKLVTRYGMSDLGPITFGGTEEMIFLGREIATEKNYSEKIAAKIDDEVRKIISYCQAAAEKILSGEKKALQAIAATLIEKETLEQDDFYAILKPFKLKQVAI